MIGGRLRNGFLIYCAPVLLCIIACLQIYLANTRSLSPWKGGGFGMFSTVDAPSARFLRIYLINKNEEIPVLVPESMNPIALQVQTMPTEARLRKLSNDIAQGIWVPYRFTPAVQRYQSLLSDDRAFLSDFSNNLQLDTSHPTDRSAFTDSPYPSHRMGPVNLGGIQFYRMIEKNELKPSSGEVVEFQSIRAELWKYKFDTGSSQLKASKSLEVTVDKAVLKR